MRVLLGADTGNYESFAIAVREESIRIVEEALDSEGYDLTASEILELLQCCEPEVEKLEQVEQKRSERHVDSAWREAELRASCPSERAGRVDRLVLHGARHRRASGGRTVRHQGSRRKAASRSGPSDDDGESEPPGLGLWRRSPHADSQNQLRALTKGAK